MSSMEYSLISCCASSPISSTSSYIRRDAQAAKLKIVLTKELSRGWAPESSSTVSRRRLISYFSGIGAAIVAGPVLPLPPQEAKASEDISRYRKLDNGVKIEDIVEGEGPKAREGDVVEINYVCRRSNGYFVHSTVDQFSGESRPVILPLDNKEIIQGLKDVLVGMRVGGFPGKRRALIPPSVGYVNDTLKPIPEEFGPRRSLLTHANEPLVFEVQLLKFFSSASSKAMHD